MEQPHPQPTARHPGHLRARRLRGRRHPPRRPPHTTPHKRGLVGQRLRRRKPSTPTVPRRNRNQPHAPKRQPKTNRQPLGRHRHRQQIRLLPPSTTSTAKSPTPPRLSNTQSATSRTSYAAQPPTTTRTSDRYYSNVGLTKHPHTTYTCRRDE